MSLSRLCLAAALALPLLRAAEAPLPDGLYAEFVTPRGTITAELFYRRVPLTVASFVGLAEGTLGPKPGTPFFNGLKFHRVVPNFVVQGGDPLGTGEGGPGYEFPDELRPGLRHDAAGVLSMANSGPDTNGSQFFFTLREVNRLNYLHSVFGRVVRGADVLPRIQVGDPMTTVTIRRIGAAAGAFRADAAAFAALRAAAPKFRGAAEPGPGAQFDDPDHLLPAEPPRALGFQRKLANYERATGRRVYARLFARSPAAPAAQSPGRAAAALAAQLKLPPDRALAVYYADKAQWALWIGDGYLEKFTGQPGSAEAQMKSHQLPKAKHALVAAAQAAAVQTADDYAHQSPPGPPLTPAQRLKLEVDAVLDALIFQLEPSSGP